VRGAKAYFRDCKDVAQWWHPERWHARHQFEQGLLASESILRQRVGVGALILDAACGRARCAARLCDGYETVAADVSAAMLREIPEDVRQRLHVVRCELENLPFCDSCFDAIICLEAMVHIDDLRTALSELARVLKSDGILIVDFDNRYGMLRLLKDVLRTFAAIFSESHREIRSARTQIFRPLSLSQVRRLLLQVGLVMESYSFVGTVMPVSIFGRTVVSVETFTTMRRWFEMLDRLPVLRRLATYIYVVVRKRQGDN